MAPRADKRPTLFLGYPSLKAKGGAEKILLELAGHFVLSYRVFVLTEDTAKEWKVLSPHPEVRHIFVPYGSKNILKIGLSLGMLAFFIIRFKPAIVHTHHRRIALLFSVFKGLPFMRFKLIHTSHNVFREGTLFRHARCDLLIGVSRHVVANLIEDFRFPENKVRLVYNGIPEFEGARPPGLEPSAVIVARLAVQKGHVFLIKAWPAVVREIPEATLYIVGEGELRPELESLAGMLGLSDRIVFAGFDPNPRPWMLKTQFGILPSLWEGLPLFPLEAFSVERTVVATAVDGTPEVVIDGQTGLLVPPKDVPKLAEAIIRMFKEPAERDRMAKEGHRLYKELFTKEPMLRNYADGYADALK